jgi:predicted TIM-barrel fold metal-dependent hydrolase
MLPLPRRLGLPGLLDLHTHFLPPNVAAKVREQFDTAGPLIGRPWLLHYRGTDEVLVETLRSHGVRRFTALSYAHRPGMAEWLNDWAAGFAERTPEAWHCATFYPEEGAAAYVARRLADGAQVLKLHVQVGGFDVRDPLLDDVWGVVAEAGTPVVLHAGSGPVATEHTGPGPVAALLARHPRLRLVVAHAGAPEYAEFLELAERYERVALDTTMAFTAFFEEMGGAYPEALLPRLRELGEAGKVHLGTDFPNIPYPYQHQLDALERLDLGDAWLRAVLWDSTDALLGPVAART